jgi:hypothetical protein
VQQQKPEQQQATMHPDMMGMHHFVCVPTLCSRWLVAILKIAGV